MDVPHASDFLCRICLLFEGIFQARRKTKCDRRRGKSLGLPPRRRMRPRRLSRSCFPPAAPSSRRRRARPRHASASCPCRARWPPAGASRRPPGRTVGGRAGPAPPRRETFRPQRGRPSSSRRPRSGRARGGGGSGGGRGGGGREGRRLRRHGAGGAGAHRWRLWSLPSRRWPRRRRRRSFFRDRFSGATTWMLSAWRGIMQCAIECNYDAQRLYNMVRE